MMASTGVIIEATPICIAAFSVEGRQLGPMPPVSPTVKLPAQHHKNSKSIFLNLLQFSSSVHIDELPFPSPWAYSHFSMPRQEIEE